MRPPVQPPQQGPRARARRHDWNDERSQALTRRVAERAKDDETIFAQALRRVRERLAMPGAERNPSLNEWERILTSCTSSEILETLVESSDRAARLRQSSPFVGVLSRDERNAIFAYFETL
ncbi:MAG TPA: hypothetical protein VK733_08890 [Gemmatimonadaceae bacterium]|jgi:hypothetical protein|nr:hypothetical protein [Gemmatimonadaceae bacterium]